MPGSRPAVGVGSYDKGIKYYEACLRYHVTRNVTAVEVRDIGLREVTRLRGLMTQVWMEINVLDKL